MALFTSEPYIAAKYPCEQLTNQLACVVSTAANSGSASYFGILAGFVRNSMKGRFQKSMIFLMGCNGLTYTDMVRAFIDRGAEICLGWYGPVQVSHTDSATERVLESFVCGEITPKEAIEKMLKEIGPDPLSGGLLVWYPSEAGDKKEDISASGRCARYM